ncbi:hypothetical protein BV25DRAFT_1866466 [Artomyces pyxidatus]|uniref:Uncharacterized protein n=1 Tax=Artomyces pyxidatus TaxID=48021 RepID=A0ACB8SCL8_9AGAM|nr:hypothetical protein BV25DRAFT_1866466 [Artomyces pyxidatus]
MAEENTSSSATKSAQSSSSSAAAKNTYKPETDYEYYKSWGGYHNFLLSYGLKPYNLEDVEEGKAILAAFREADKYAHDQEQLGN